MYESERMWSPVGTLLQQRQLDGYTVWRQIVRTVENILRMERKADMAA